MPNVIPLTLLTLLAAPAAAAPTWSAVVRHRCAGATTWTESLSPCSDALLQVVVTGPRAWVSARAEGLCLWPLPGQTPGEPDLTTGGPLRVRSSAVDDESGYRIDGTTAPFTITVQVWAPRSEKGPRGASCREAREAPDQQIELQVTPMACSCGPKVPR